MKLKLAVLLGALAGALLFVGPAAAHTQAGNPGDQDPSIGTVVPGNTCSSDQAHANQGRGAKGEKGGEEYRCRKAGDCYRWKYVYNPHTPKSGKTAWPHKPCPCASSTPTATGSPTTPASPTVSPSATTTATANTQASPTTAPSAPTVQVVTTGSLPVTGGPIVGLLVLGGLSLAVGLLILAAVRTWRRRTT